MPAEIELKIKIPDLASYHKVLNHLGSPVSEWFHTNYYFDTKARDFFHEKTMLRVRFDGSQYIATIKKKAKQIDGIQSSEEQERVLPSFSLKADRFNDIFECFFDLEELKVSSSIVYIGSIENNRKVFDLNGQAIELDRTTIGESVYYEIEVESATRAKEFG